MNRTETASSAAAEAHHGSTEGAPVNVNEQPVLPAPRDRLDRKTLMVFLGFFVGLVALVVLNMN